MHRPWEPGTCIKVLMQGKSFCTGLSYLVVNALIKPAMRSDLCTQWHDDCSLGHHLSCIAHMSPLESVCAALRSSGLEGEPVLAGPRCVDGIHSRQYSLTAASFATIARVYVTQQSTYQKLVRPFVSANSMPKTKGHTCLDPRNLACTLVPGFEAGCAGL